MKKISIYFLSFLLVVGVVACKKTPAPTPTPPVAVVPKAKLMNLPAGWNYATLINATFPDGIELYYFDSIHAGKKTKMFCVAYSSKNNLFELTNNKLNYNDENLFIMFDINGDGMEKYFKISSSLNLSSFSFMISS